MFSLYFFTKHRKLVLPSVIVLFQFLGLSFIISYEIAQMLHNLTLLSSSISSTQQYLVTSPAL